MPYAAPTIDQVQFCPQFFRALLTLFRKLQQRLDKRVLSEQTTRPGALPFES
jgi:hypothetical protein